MILIKEQLAARLNGREYLSETENDDMRDAGESGLVILFGSGDDLAEFRGKIHDEVGVYGGGVILLNKHGTVEEPDEDEKDTLQKFGVLDKVDGNFKKITAVWNRDGYSWTYETEIPHATFDVMEDGEKYCQGIVFNLSDL